MNSPARLIAWAQPSQRQLVADAAVGEGIELVGVASALPDDAARLAEALGVPRVDDVPRALRAGAADALWLAAPWFEEARVREAVRSPGLRAFMSEPPPPAFGEEATTIAPAEFAPLTRRSPGYLAAGAALESLAPAYCLNIAIRCGRGQGSLFARLYDALDLVNAICGQPETIDAACAGPLTAMPDSLPLMTGSITANLRFRENRCASLAVTDQAGSWFRGVTALGETGCVRIDDQGFEWLGSDSRIIDSHREREAQSPGRLIGLQLGQSLSGGAAAAPPDHPTLLALCESVRLSCRTGEPEEPRRVMEMISRP